MKLETNKTGPTLTQKNPITHQPITKHTKLKQACVLVGLCGPFHKGHVPNNEFVPDACRSYPIRAD